MAEDLAHLISMSRVLGQPREDLVILGEGNTSARADDSSFWVKASGTQLIKADETTFVRVQFDRVLAALREDNMTDDQVKQVLTTATVEGDRTPSIETFLHALCLELEGVRFVGHTHPTAAVSLLCSRQSQELFQGSLFPDQIVLLGPSQVYVPYCDPGLPLALEVQRQIEAFLEREQRVPRVILMENHGVIALGTTAQEVVNITQMLVKTCRIVAGTLHAGGPRFLTDAHVRRIDRRPDELYRRSLP
jgi:rhamnose utilization protein RhaD (predicted bifunctional aldolase and dehydrogenase)